MIRGLLYAYGPLPAFLYAWTWFLIAKPASIATLATGFVRVLGDFPALAFFSHNMVTKPFHMTYGQLVTVAAAIFISFINYIGVKRAGEFQLLFTILKVAIILAIIFIAFSYSGATWHNFSTTFSGAKGGLAGFMAANPLDPLVLLGRNKKAIPDITRTSGEKGSDTFLAAKT